MEEENHDGQSLGAGALGPLWLPRIRICQGVSAPRKCRAGELSTRAGLAERTSGYLPRQDFTPRSPAALPGPPCAPKRNPPKASQCKKPSTGYTKRLEKLSPAQMQAHKQEQNVTNGEYL